VTYLPVSAEGLVSVQEVEKAISPQTILISIMHANNEVGTIQPIREIAELAHHHGILVHSDCAQSVGKIPAQVNELQVDLLSIAGHKLYAPKGIGALFVRRGVKLEKQIHGADHERDWRAGTENVIEIVGLGKACELVDQNLAKTGQHLQSLRKHLEETLKEQFPDIRINGHKQLRLPNTSSISFKGLEANTIVSELSERVAVSAGAACHSENVEVSSVLQAMAVPLEYAMGTIRFSVGRFTTRDELERALQQIIDVVEKLQPSATPFFLDASQNDIKLTHFTHGLGCACKLRPQLLEDVLQQLPKPEDQRILVGSETADDAAVYQIDTHTAIIQTVDFFTPIVDNAFDFGRIAAANSLSDIYAMGGKPLFALNLVGFPSNRLPMSVLQQILDGAQHVAAEAGIAIIGGHTVDDAEPKFGLAVSGLIDPQKIIRNVGCRPGDALILTKALGTGIFSTALKRGLLNGTQRDLLVQLMSALNRAAAEAMQHVGVHACTDVTGFGLLGHLLEMLRASGVSARIRFSQIPFLEGTEELAAAGAISGGSKDNFSFTEPAVDYDGQLTELQRLLINDAQTSGGLLISVENSKSEQLLRALAERGVSTRAVIGEIIGNGSSRVSVEV